MVDTRAAWSEYWRAQSPGQGSGCLPNQASDHSLRAFWANFSSQLPKRAVVLDLCCGDGAVLKLLGSKRRDLKLTGVDSAIGLPTAGNGIKLKPGVDICSLPVASESIDAVTSQFGFEYSDAEAAVAEIARVLRPGGQVAMVLHHEAGIILAFNTVRLEALSWVLDEHGLIEKARRFAASLLATARPPGLFAEAAADAKARFPKTAVGQELCHAISMSLDLGRARPIAEVLTALDELDRRARNEMARIQDLAQACCSPDRIERYCSWLSAHGATGINTDILPAPDASARPLAWTLRASF